MRLNDFQLERYFGQYEFSAKYLLSSSDCDGFALGYLLEGASDQERAMWEKMQFGYTESEGHSVLRQSILQFYAMDAIENVIVASPGELNFAAMHVLLERGDHVVTVSPSYQSLHEVVRSIGCEISFWKPNPANWQFDPSDLKRLVKHNTRLIIINFPHNPTGSYLTSEEQREVIDIASKQGCYLFSDEMYHKLALNGSKELHPAADLYEKGISLWGTSKTFGLAGLRTGWLVSQDQIFLKKVLAFKDYLSICSSAPAEILSLIALNSIDRFLQPNLSKIEENVGHFANFAAEHALFGKFIAPKAGSVAFVPIHTDGTARDFCENLVQKTGIMMVPGEMFNATEKFLRIGFGRKIFPEALQKLGEFLKSGNL